MFKSFQDTSSQSQFKSFANLNMQQATSAYGFSGVTFWLDAAYGLNTQTNLGAVSRWQARVGGSVFEQATAAAQPRLILNDANFNNLPSIESIDNARWMSVPSGNGLRINNSFTIVVVSKLNFNSPQNGIVGIGNNTGLVDGGSTAGYNGFGYSVGSPVFQGTTESLNARIKIISSTNVIVNGVNEASGTLNRIDEFVNIFRTQSVAFPYIGTIAEIIAYNYSMTSTDAIALSDRINQKYALY